MTLPLWVWAALMGAIAQTGRNATQAGLTSALGTVGATQVRFLFGLPFAAVARLEGLLEHYPTFRRKDAARGGPSLAKTLNAAKEKKVRAIVIAGLVAPLLALPAQAGVMRMTCGSGAAAYDLMLDDDNGVMVSTANNIDTKLVLRGVKRENGSVYARGYLAGRGTEFEFTSKYTTEISYLFGNGGRRTDECRIISNSR